MAAKTNKSADRPAAEEAGAEASTPAAKPAPKAPAANAAQKATTAKAVRPRPAPAAASTGDGGDDAEEFVPMNRAERRAKGRGKSTVQVPGGRGKVSGGHGPAHAQRNWANRRTG